jgi:hypothetical protein
LVQERPEDSKIELWSGGLNTFTEAAQYTQCHSDPVFTILQNLLMQNGRNAKKGGRLDEPVEPVDAIEVIKEGGKLSKLIIQIPERDLEIITLSDPEAPGTETKLPPYKVTYRSIEVAGVNKLELESFEFDFSESQPDDLIQLYKVLEDLGHEGATTFLAAALLKQNGFHDATKGDVDLLARGIKLVSKKACGKMPVEAVLNVKVPKTMREALRSATRESSFTKEVTHRPHRVEGCTFKALQQQQDKAALRTSAESTA